MHRAAFLDALVQHVPPARTHFHKRCTHLTVPDDDGATSTSAITLHFADGSAATADVVLGADGIKSAVRRHTTDTHGTAVDPYLKFSKTVCYRALVPAAFAAAAGVALDFADRPVCFVGENKHIVVFAIRGGTLVRATLPSVRPSFMQPVR